jgi:hypothetical protein
VFHHRFDLLGVVDGKDQRITPRRDLGERLRKNAAAPFERRSRSRVDVKPAGPEPGRDQPLCDGAAEQAQANNANLAVCIHARLTQTCVWARRGPERETGQIAGSPNQKDVIWRGPPKRARRISWTGAEPSGLTDTRISA